MPWFKVDDMFWSHPKVITTDLDAIGLWVIAGTWSAGHLTDGDVPESILLRLSPLSRSKTLRLAAELVDNGLWITTDDGYLFKDWAEFQRKSDEVLEERRANTERQKRFRQRKKNSKMQSGRGNEDNVTPLVTRYDGVSNGPPDPTRPDLSNDPPKKGALDSGDNRDALNCAHGYPNCDGTQCGLCRNSQQAGEQE